MRYAPALLALAACLSAGLVRARDSITPDGITPDQLPPATLKACGSTIDAVFAPGPLDLDRANILHWIQTSADSVATYYGRFLVAHTTVRIIPSPGRRGVGRGETWGFPTVHHRVDLGQHTTAADLDDDWEMTHEFVHTAFPDLEDSHHWIEEGIAVYVEPITRVQHGTLQQDQVWADMIRNMPKGEPHSGDHGLDQTHSWASTYWGGALFFLAADVAIREHTANHKGLQDALRAIALVKTIDSHGTPEEAFAIGDRAVGGSVLETMYADMRDKPVAIDLNALWQKLGVRAAGANTVRYDDTAPDAAIRKAIFQRQPGCGAQVVPVSR